LNRHWQPAPASVAASNRNTQAMVKDGQFRQALNHPGIPGDSME